MTKLHIPAHEPYFGSQSQAIRDAHVLCAEIILQARIDCEYPIAALELRRAATDLSRALLDVTHDEGDQHVRIGIQGSELRARFQEFQEQRRALAERRDLANKISFDVAEEPDLTHVKAVTQRIEAALDSHQEVVVRIGGTRFADSRETYGESCEFRILKRENSFSIQYYEYFGIAKHFDEVSRRFEQRGIKTEWFRGDCYTYTPTVIGAAYDKPPRIFYCVGFVHDWGGAEVSGLVTQIAREEALTLASEILSAVIATSSDSLFIQQVKDGVYDREESAHVASKRFSVGTCRVKENPFAAFKFPDVLCADITTYDVSLARAFLDGRISYEQCRRGHILPEDLETVDSEFRTSGIRVVILGCATLPEVRRRIEQLTGRSTIYVQESYLEKGSRIAWSTDPERFPLGSALALSLERYRAARMC